MVTPSAGSVILGACPRIPVGCVAGASGLDARRGDAGDALECIAEEPQRGSRPADAATRRDAATSGRPRCRSSSAMRSVASPPPRSLRAARIGGVAASRGFSDRLLVPFPFSDLSQAKLRPAVVLADAGRGDWVLCQITSNPYGDARSVTLTDADLAAGSLRVVSYARPGKLFTANRELLSAELGALRRETFRRLVRAVVDLLECALAR